MIYCVFPMESNFNASLNVKEGEKLFGNEMILTFEKSNNLLDASDTEF